MKASQEAAKRTVATVPATVPGRVSLSTLARVDWESHRNTGLELLRSESSGFPLSQWKPTRSVTSSAVRGPVSAAPPPSQTKADATKRHRSDTPPSQPLSPSRKAAKQPRVRDEITLVADDEDAEGEDEAVQVDQSLAFDDDEVQVVSGPVTVQPDLTHPLVNPTPPALAALWQGAQAMTAGMEPYRRRLMSRQLGLAPIPRRGPVTREEVDVELALARTRMELQDLFTEVRGSLERMQSLVHMQGTFRNMRRMVYVQEGGRDEDLRDTPELSDGEEWMPPGSTGPAL